MIALLAQEAADNTGRTVTLIIIGLLGVAALLAVLTVWYWNYTDPRKRRATPVGEPIGNTGSNIPAPGTRTSAAGAVTVGPSVAGRAVAAEEDDGVDEWLRLTGPQAGRTPR